MTTATLVTNTTFSNIAKGRILSNRDYLVGEYLFGGSQAASVKNRANPALPLTVQGAPTYNAHSAVIRANASTGYGFQSGIIPDETFTWILVRKNSTVNGGSPTIMGMPTIPSGSVWGFREFGSTNNYGSAGESTALGTTGSPFRTKPSAGTIYFEAIAHIARDYTQYYSAASGAVSVAPNAAAGVALQRRSSGSTQTQVYSQVLIGTTGLPDTSTTTNTTEIVFAAIYNKTLSSAEVAQAYSDVKAYLATLSVTVD